MDDEKMSKIGMFITTLPNRIFKSALTNAEYEEIYSSFSHDFDILIDEIINSLRRNVNLFDEVDYELFESLSKQVNILYNSLDKTITLTLTFEGVKSQNALTCPTFKMFIFSINLVVRLCNKLFRFNDLEYSVRIKPRENVTKNMERCNISDEELNVLLPKLYERLPRLDVLQIPVEADGVEADGGSKSRRRRRRKDARKTRRGRGRKSKSKPKTHRRRRAHHSRIRKHKKYTRKR